MAIWSVMAIMAIGVVEYVWMDGGNWCARRKSVVEVEADVQLIYKETARALARLEVRQQRSRHRRSCEGGVLGLCEV
jgi:hypothetical protein